MAGSKVSINMALYLIGAYFAALMLIRIILPDALVTVILEHGLTVICFLCIHQLLYYYQSENKSYAAIVATPFPCFFQI
jgi:hypothetical protein